MINPRMRERQAILGIFTLLAVLSLTTLNWARMVYKCEAKGVVDPWYANTGNTFYFGPQFTYRTWHANGGGPVKEMGDRHGKPMHSYSIGYIIHVAEKTYRSQGPGAWPNCHGYLYG